MDEITIVGILSGFGVLSGVGTGIVCVRRRKDMAAALFSSGLVGTFLPLVVWYMVIVVGILKISQGPTTGDY